MNLEQSYTCYDSEEEKDFIESALEDEVITIDELLE
jgi:hypothetical protein